MMDNVFKWFTYGKKLSRSSYSPNKDDEEDDEDPSIFVLFTFILL